MFKKLDPLPSVRFAKWLKRTMDELDCTAYGLSNFIDDGAHWKRLISEAMKTTKGSRIAYDTCSTIGRALVQFGEEHRGVTVTPPNPFQLSDEDEQGGGR